MTPTLTAGLPPKAPPAHQPTFDFDPQDLSYETRAQLEAAQSFEEMAVSFQTTCEKIAASRRDPEEQAEAQEAEQRLHADLQKVMAFGQDVLRLLSVPNTLTRLIYPTASLRAYVRRNRERRPGTRRPVASARSRRSRRTTKAASPTRGDPDPSGDPDPGGQAQAGRGATDTGGRFCKGCGHDISDKAPQARFCSDACRMRFQRANKAAAKLPGPRVGEAVTIAGVTFVWSEDGTEVVAEPYVAPPLRPDAQDELEAKAYRRHLAWQGRVDDDAAALSREIAGLWDAVRRSRVAAGVVV